MSIVEFKILYFVLGLIFGHTSTLVILAWRKKK